MKKFSNNTSLVLFLSVFQLTACVENIDNHYMHSNNRNYEARNSDLKNIINSNTLLQIVYLPDEESCKYQIECSQGKVLFDPNGAAHNEGLPNALYICRLNCAFFGVLVSLYESLKHKKEGSKDALKKYFSEMLDCVKDTCNKNSKEPTGPYCKASKILSDFLLEKEKKEGLFQQIWKQQDIALENILEFLKTSFANYGEVQSRKDKLKETLTSMHNVAADYYNPELEKEFAMKFPFFSKNINIALFWVLEDLVEALHAEAIDNNAANEIELSDIEKYRKYVPQIIAYMRSSNMLTEQEKKGSSFFKLKHYGNQEKYNFNNLFGFMHASNVKPWFKNYKTSVYILFDELGALIYEKLPKVDFFSRTTWEAIQSMYNKGNEEHEVAREMIHCVHGIHHDSDQKVRTNLMKHIWYDVLIKPKIYKFDDMMNEFLKFLDKELTDNLESAIEICNIKNINTEETFEEGQIIGYFNEHYEFFKLVYDCMLYIYDSSPKRSWKGTHYTAIITHSLLDSDLQKLRKFFLRINGYFSKPI